MRFDASRFASRRDHELPVTALAREDSPGPCQPLEADVAFGGRFGLKYDAGPSPFTGDDSREPDRPLEDGVAYGGRFALKDDSDFGDLTGDD